MKENISHPKHFHTSYTTDDQKNVLKAIEWLNQKNQSQAYLARLSRIKAGTLSRILAGDYPSTPAKYIDQITQAIAHIADRESKGKIPFVKTTVYEMVEAVCKRSRMYGNFGVLSGYVGVGKTYCLKHYAHNHPNTILIESDPDFTPSALLNDLILATQAVSHKTHPNNIEKFRAVVLALKGSNTLLIVDEAETMQPRVLHYLRRIRDKAEIGIVLSGTEFLSGLIKPHHGQFDQIRSRTPFIPNTITTISCEDAKLLIEAGLGVNDNQLFKKLWRYCQGSARVLTEGLIPAIIDYGIKQGKTLNTTLIDSIASQVLGLKQQ